MWLLTINEPSILYQTSLLSCLSTTVAPVHKPPLLNRVVNPQQPNSGTQCGAHGRWIDPSAHRHTAQLLDDSASLPPLREQQHQHHHQLAHVGWLTANMKSHTRIAFSQEKNCSKCMTLQCSWQWAVHHTITHQRRARGLCAVNSGGHCACVAYIHSIPRGKEKTKRNPTTRWEVFRSSLRWAESLRQRGHTIIHSTGCCKLHSVKGDSARGTEHLKCHGHIGQWWQPEPVFGSGQVRQIFLYF